MGLNFSKHVMGLDLFPDHAQLFLLQCFWYSFGKNKILPMRYFKASDCRHSRETPTLRSVLA